MKVPPLRELKRLNRELRTEADKKYREVLRSVVCQWTAVSGDASLEQAIRSWNVPLMLQISDALVDAQHSTATTHFVAHQMAALIRKYPWTESQSGLTPEATAIRTFYAAEHRCKRTNQWFRAWRRRTVKNRPHALYFSRMQRWIEHVIGSTPNLPSIYSKCDLTSGASVGVHGDATNLGRKLLAQSWTVTPTALPYFAAALCANFHYATRVAQKGVCTQSFYVSENDVRTACSLVHYNKVGFVLKTAKTHRGIAAEPLANNYLQKGTDSEFRDFLKAVGLDLRYQAPNQRMAYEGSFDGDEGFVTIDLKTSSDTKATEMCREMLPPDWFNFLNRIRSPSFRMPDGTERPYQKFVSMGNGFCFPLQTLIFAAAIKAVDPTAVAGVDFRVYGDDIIVRKAISSSVINLLNVLGFETNRRKTFLSGPFRESCGSNWYSGEDVTPMTLDWKLDSLEGLFKFLNLSRRNARTSAFFSDCYAPIFRGIPDQFLFWRPFKGRPETGIDPAGLEFTPRWTRHSAMQCPMWLELHTIPVEDRIAGLSNASWVVMAAALRGHSSSKPFAFRRRVETRIRRVASGAPEMVSDSTPGSLSPLVGEGAKAAFIFTKQPDLRDYRLIR